MAKRLHQLLRRKRIIDEVFRNAEVEELPAREVWARTTDEENHTKMTISVEVLEEEEEG